MTASERWENRSRTKEIQITVRVSESEMVYIRRLAFQYNLPIAQVVRDLMADGITVLEKRIQI